MELIFLGTSSGTPTRQRNVSGLALRMQNAKSWCLIDCGEGTQHQILRTNLALNHLQAIFITHVHGDHCFGLPGLLASASLTMRTAPLTIVAPRGVREMFEVIKTCTQLRLTYDIRFVDVEDMSGVREVCSGFMIDVVMLSHRVPSYGYVFTEKHVAGKLDIAKLRAEGIEAGPVWGRIQQQEDVTLTDGREIKARDFLLETRRPRTIAIAGDNDMPEVFADVADSLDVLVHEATYTHETMEKVGAGPQHSSAKLVGQFAQQVEIPNLVLTHFSARYKEVGAGEPSVAMLEQEARDYYDGRLFLARDLEVYRLDVEGVLECVAGW